MKNLIRNGCGVLILILCLAASAQTWTQTSAPSNEWNSIASSADGSKLVALARNNGVIYTSTNSGSTWTDTSPTNYYWESVAISADGSRMVVGAVDSSFTNDLFYISTNSGFIWKQISAFSNPPGTALLSLASSSDGAKLAAVVYGVGIYVSTNLGNAWTLSCASNKDLVSIASSTDGTKLVAVANNATQNPTNFIYYGGPILLSTNSGATWVQANGVSNAVGWQAVASSADGTKLAAVDANHIFTSMDSGLDWMQTSAPFGQWHNVASSKDGNKLVAGTKLQSSSWVYTSTNAGATWVSNSIPSFFNSGYAVTCSADGNESLAATGEFPSGPIYISYSTPPPQLNITPSSSNPTLSWTVPSTNFVIQQSSDLQNWTDTTNTPTLNLTNLQNELVLSPTNSNGFYRLKTP